MGKYTELQREAYEANMQIPAQHLALYTWGNVSAFDPDEGVFAIKPSGVPYPELTAGSMVIVDLDGNVVEGNLRPSSDTPTHAVLYREFAVKDGAKIRGIIHTHSTYAVSWAQAVKPVPLFGTTHADHIQTEIPCTPYLSEEAVKNDYEKETILRPLNFPDSCPGHGCTIWDNGPYQVAVINLMGTAYMDPLDNPFTVIEEFLPTLPTKNIIVDFHAEATAEKKAKVLSGVPS